MNKKSIIITSILCLICIIICGSLLYFNKSKEHKFDIIAIENYMKDNYQKLNLESMDQFDILESFGVDISQFSEALFLTNYYEINGFNDFEIVPKDDTDEEDYDPETENDTSLGENVELHEFLHPNDGLIVINFKKIDEMDYYYDFFISHFEMLYLNTEKDVYKDVIIKKDDKFIYVVFGKEKEKIEKDLSKFYVEK